MPPTFAFQASLLMILCEEFGFHLCEEHYWWNPAKLPTPAEWVNVRRIRVKDAVNSIWWLSPTPWPKANNRRVLAPYSDAMLDLLEHGYTPRLRPSGHDISDKFVKNNGGSVPPNLLALANTESNGRYQDYCRERHLPIHPARFPGLIPEYFVRMLTDKNDLVVDPFARSCVTGEVCESLERQWICCELNSEYLEGATVRFVPNRANNGQHRSEMVSSDPHCPHCGRRVEPRWIRSQHRRINQGGYTIYPPLVVTIPDEDAPLQADGGRTRPPANGIPTNGTHPVSNAGKRAPAQFEFLDWYQESRYCQ
jgi:site-specific DNA-methyltransferase (cytosine-N4-specific)